MFNSNIFSFNYEKFDLVHIFLERISIWCNNPEVRGWQVIYSLPTPVYCKCMDGNSLIYFTYSIRFYLPFPAAAWHKISKIVLKKTHGSFSNGWARKSTHEMVLITIVSQVWRCVCVAVCELSRNILNEIACSNLNCSTPPPLTVEPRSSFKLFTSDMVPC